MHGGAVVDPLDRVAELSSFTIGRRLRPVTDRLAVKPVISGSYY